MKWNNTQYLHSSYLININLRTKDSFHFRILTTNDWSCSMIHGAFVLSRLIRENVIYKSTTDTLFLSLSLSFVPFIYHSYYDSFEFWYLQWSLSTSFSNTLLSHDFFFFKSIQNSHTVKSRFIFLYRRCDAYLFAEFWVLSCTKFSHYNE